jgi:hypothetical protein
MSDVEAPPDDSEPAAADEDAELSVAAEDAELSAEVSDAAEEADWSEELDDDPPEQAVIATAARTAISDVVSKRMYFSL